MGDSMTTHVINLPVRTFHVSAKSVGSLEMRRQAELTRRYNFRRILQKIDPFDDAGDKPPCVAVKISTLFGDD